MRDFSKIITQNEVNIKKAFKIYNAFFSDVPYRRKYTDLKIFDKIMKYKNGTGKSLIEKYAEVCNIKEEVKAILKILYFMDGKYYTDRIYFENSVCNMLRNGRSVHYVVSAPCWSYDRIYYVVDKRK